jgi:hypothetical protein
MLRTAPKATQRGGQMSQINGDKARFQKNRKRKLQQRVRTRALIAQLKQQSEAGGKTVHKRSK